MVDVIVGLLMIDGEDDVLERVIAEHERIVDVFYVLDGTWPNDYSEMICKTSDKCGGYLTDRDLPRPRFPAQARDGSRQALLELAYAAHGHDNWFALLHGDEVWECDPREVIASPNGTDGFGFRLPFYFPRAGEPWREDVHPLDQLRWSLGPGFPEFRLFRGGPGVGFDPFQHSSTRPGGIESVQWTSDTIRHYLYRSPENQIARAERRRATGFDPANYEHISAEGGVYWTDEMIDDYRQKPHAYFTELRHD